METAEALWSLKEVSLGRGAPPRLVDVTLSIYPGVTAVMGYSGAGKTSLLNLLVGFEKPDGGTLLMPRSFAWAPQNNGLWPHLTAREHLDIVAPGDPARVSAALSDFDLVERSAARPDQLSEGEQSRLAVARALLMEAPILVMDEPLVHVDPARAANYWDCIRRNLAATGRSLVFSTHVPEAVMGEAQRVVCLREGRVIYAGPVDELYWEPASIELAGCLGPHNWMNPGEARLWLGREQSTARAYRPEQIVIRADESGPFVVEAARFRGSFGEADLRDRATHTVRRFYHRPSANCLGVGTRVILHLALVLCLLLLAGCGNSSDPVLDVREMHSWILPPDGPMLPTPRSVAIGKDDTIAALDTAGRILIYSAEGALLRQWKMPDTAVGKPEGICVLSDGRVVVCDTHYHQVVFFDAHGTILKKVGRMGNGPGEFIYPVGITKDSRENLYICEYGGNDRIQKFTRDGEFVSSFGGFGTGPGQFQRPSGLAWKDGKLYIADAINNRIHIFTDEGKYQGLLGDGATPLALQFPYGIAVGGDGALYIIEYGAGRLTKTSLEGKLLCRFGSTGTGERQFATPWGLAIDSRMRIRIADTKNRRIATCEL